ncbi:MAG: hypothetical protein Q8R18_02350 [bacterium]|nr:hypothetical protein [bacterium]
MSAFLQYAEHLRFPLENMCAGDILLFENFDSPFYAKTGISLAYISRINEGSFVVQRYKTKDGSRIPVRNRVEKEIPFSAISSLELRFPFAPDGSIYSLSLKK